MRRYAAACFLGTGMTNPSTYLAIGTLLWVSPMSIHGSRNRHPENMAGADAVLPLVVVPDLDQVPVRIVAVHRAPRAVRAIGFAGRAHVADRVEGVAELDAGVANALQDPVELGSRRRERQVLAAPRSPRPQLQH